MEGRYGEVPEIQAAFGAAFLENGAPQLALPHLEAAVSGGTADAPTLTRYALAASQTGDNETAAAAARKALALDPDNPTAQSVLKLSETQLPQGRTDSAMKDLKAFHPDPSPGKAAAASLESYASPRLFYEDGAPPEKGASGGADRVRAALRMGETDRALKLAEEAVQRSPSAASSYQSRAGARYQRGDFAGALADLDRGLSLAPGSVPMTLERALVLNKLRRFGEALDAAGAALLRQPSSWRAYELKAFALAGLGDRRAMSAALAKAARLNPALAGLYRASLGLAESADPLELFDPDLIDPARRAGNPAPSPSGKSPLLLLAVLFLGIGTGLYARRILGLLSRRREISRPPSA